MDGLDLIQPSPCDRQTFYTLRQIIGANENIPDWSRASCDLRQGIPETLIDDGLMDRLREYFRMGKRGFVRAGLTVHTSTSHDAYLH